MKSWYVIHTKPRKEGTVMTLLERAGIECYAPQYRSRRVRRGRYADTVQHLFPGYVFARLQISTQLWKVTYTRGVKNVVAIGGRPISVPDEAIEFIRTREQNGYIQGLGEEFAEGDTIEILDGPFAGLQGVFLRPMSDSDRALVLLSAIEYQANIIVDRGLLIKA